ncbi:uncharacterized protein LOC100890721 [Strongylocentrotus purpuratus]|uniref:CCHC-type domain-containing protein n=1 Tax=Strongylocentrotus purpuratus TaxID=7668 RepID=A0A7M7GK74_STRPU|nr:uncharacterized protein LOC100890721 [Strongylocentrotus purpuratus]
MSEGEEASKRDRKPTEKGIKHQADVASKSWKVAIRLWCRMANKHRQLIVEDDIKAEVIKESRNNVQEAMDKAIVVQQELADLAPSASLEDDGEDRLDEMEEEHSSLMRETMRIIIQLKGGTHASKSGSGSPKPGVRDWVNEQAPVSPMEPAVQKDDEVIHQPAEKSSNEDVLANSLKELLCLNRLPLPEPGHFSGNPLEYTSWKRSYDALIEHRGIPIEERFYFLLKYLSGEPKSLVQGYSMIGDAAGYNEAKKVLEQRYGDPFVVSNAYRDKLDSWPRVGSRDASGLRRLGDFLKQCDTASKYVHHLSHLDDERENRKLLMKLPDWLVVKWSRKVVQWRREWGTFPPFSIFTEFIEEEAVVANDPVTSLQSLQTSNERKKSATSSFMQTETHQNQRDGSAERGILTCIFCKGRHHLTECSPFNSETMQKKRKVVRDNGLCFGCLKKGHISKKCNKRNTCSSCRGKHPTVLHDDEWKERRQDAASRERGKKRTLESKSYASNSDSSHSTKSSMIVPVWLSHESCHKDRLVYALLDTQSDTSFILTNTKEAMGIKGVGVNLLLSTMTRANERIASEKVTGLRVKAFNDPKKIISLPPTFARDIMPADRNHIPTPDCAKALAPRAVIHSPDDRGPYAIQTDLGWSIVGTVKAGYADSHNDPFGVSHRTIVRVVPDEVQLKGQRSEVIFIHSANMKEEIAPLHVVRLLEADFTPDRKQKPYSQNDMKFIRLMKKEVHITESGHYEMPLPFKEEEMPTLPNNRFVAVKRLDHLKRKFENDATYYDRYLQQMNNLLHKKYAERVSEPGESGNRWYIPHHGVQQPKKLRMVFDCSSQFKGECLNSHLLTGPDLTNALAGVLCRFRKEKVAFMCDIKEMSISFMSTRNIVTAYASSGGQMETTTKSLLTIV